MGCLDSSLAAREYISSVRSRANTDALGKLSASLQMAEPSFVLVPPTRQTLSSFTMSSWI